MRVWQSAVVAVRRSVTVMPRVSVPCCSTWMGAGMQVMSVGARTRATAQGSCTIAPVWELPVVR